MHLVLVQEANGFEEASLVGRRESDEGLEEGEREVEGARPKRYVRLAAARWRTRRGSLPLLVTFSRSSCVIW